MSSVSPQRRFSIWRSLARPLLYGGITYLGLLVVLLLLENWFIFRPSKATDYWEPAKQGSVEDVWLTLADGTRIHGWWHPTPDARWVVLYCHGNAGNVSQWHPGAREWQEQVGASVLLFDYPGYGKSAGSPCEEGCYAAGEAAYRWLIEEKRVSPPQLVLHGVSLGGGVAVELASRHPHHALVLLCTFTSLPDMAQKSFPFVPARWLCRTRFDNLAKLHQYQGPLFLAHGTTDELVPFEHSRRLLEACPSTCKALFPVAGAHHGNAATRDYYAAVRRFLASRPSFD